MSVNETRQRVYPIRLVYDKAPIPGWEDIRRTTDVHSLYWIAAGRGEFRTDARCDGAEAGMLFYLPPGLRMEMHSSREAPLHVRMVLFDVVCLHPEGGTWVAEEQREPMKLPYVRAYAGKDRLDTDERFERIQRHWRPVMAEQPAELQYEMAQILGSLNAEGCGTDSPQQAFRSVLKWIDAHYSSPVRMQELARRHGVSSSHLRQLFLRNLGLPPKAYLNRVRNEQAKRYLLLTDEPVKRIAASCGFADEQHFGKMFRAWNDGMSPSRYRKLHRR